MRLVALGLVAAFWTTPSVASEAVPQTQACKAISIVAKSIMGARQQGVPMSTVIEVFEDEPKPELRAMYQGMVAVAYRGPRYSTPAVIERAVSNFENDAYLACFDAPEARR